jgi:hypothetical protein
MCLFSAWWYFRSYFFTVTNLKVAMKFITTLAKLKKKDPEIYKPEVKFFQEEDFDHAEVLLGKRGDIRSSQLTKKLTYKD